MEEENANPTAAAERLKPPKALQVPPCCCTTHRPGLYGHLPWRVPRVQGLTITKFISNFEEDS